MEQSVNISNEQWKSKRTADRHPNVLGGEFLTLQNQKGLSEVEVSRKIIFWKYKFKYII